MEQMALVIEFAHHRISPTYTCVPHVRALHTLHVSIQKGYRPGMTMPSNSTISALRPSLVIAEALVERQRPSQIVDRARELGFSPTLTSAVVGACCGERSCDLVVPAASSLASSQSIDAD
jgi:hypothetical protein